MIPRGEPGTSRNAGVWYKRILPWAYASSYCEFLDPSYILEMVNRYSVAGKKCPKTGVVNLDC